MDGMAKYGERYKSIYWFAILHNDGSGNSVCDEFHGDIGFLPNNMFLVNYLEQSLQLVNPKVALPYVEYSMYFESENFEEHLALQLSGGVWRVEWLAYFNTSYPNISYYTPLFHTTLKKKNTIFLFTSYHI